MNIAVDFFTGPRRLGLVIWARVSFFFCAAGVVSAQSKLELRALANTKEEKDKKAIETEKDHFAKAKTDDKLKEKLAKAATDGVAPDFNETPAADPVNPGKVIGLLAAPGSLLDAIA